MRVVTSLTRSIRYIDKIRTLVGAGRAGFQFVQGAMLVVTSLTRSIRSIYKVRTQKHLVGDGFPVPSAARGRPLAGPYK